MPPTSGSEPAIGPVPAISATACVVGFDGVTLRTIQRDVAQELPVQVVYGALPFAVMMMTPADLADFAVGFSLCEGVIQRAEDLRGSRVEQSADGLRLVIDLAPTAFHAHLARRRTLTGRTGCGVCGVETLEDLPLVTRRPVPGLRIDTSAIRRALDGLEVLQELNRATGAVHAAGFADLDGRMLLVREDVGRHNALDKLIGATLLGGLDPAAGFVVVTSRASFEMVEKVAAFGGHALIAISMPTSLAIERARRHGITLVGLARRDNMTVFHGMERIGTELISA